MYFWQKFKCEPLWVHGIWHCDETIECKSNTAKFFSLRKAHKTMQIAMVKQNKRKNMFLCLLRKYHKITINCALYDITWYNPIDAVPVAIATVARFNVFWVLFLQEKKNFYKLTKQLEYSKHFFSYRQIYSDAWRRRFGE